MIHHVVVLVASLVASMFLLYGWIGHEAILSKNQCKMTYSQPKKTQVQVNETLTGYKLWKVTNADSKKLNRFPVLFIPGHLGSVDQSRSFASYMHNDDNELQFFSLDFGGEPIAFHGGDILTKATFLNKALDAIVRLYEKAGRSSSELKVGLLGHSYGGFVAKTSMVLSDHSKQCVVKLIVMLSAPNTRAPFSPDSSFSPLFWDVNKAWYQSYYKDKSKCPAKYYDKDRIELMPCSKCLSNVTVLSFTGGEVDSHVRPEWTNLFDVSARPKNITFAKQVAKPSGVVTLSLFSYVKKQIWQYGRQLFSGLFFSSSSNTTSNSTLVNANTSAASAIVETPLSEAPLINSSSPFAAITAERWFKDMAAYDDPHHISIRTSQMSDVGFQIDHYAILWCYQFVSATNAAIKSILRRKTPFNANDTFELHQLLKIQGVNRIEESLVEPQKLGIQQLLNYIRRNETNNEFQRHHSLENAELLQSLHGNLVQHYAVQFYLHHMHKIPVGFYNAGILSVINSLLALLLAEPYATTSSSSLVTVMNVFEIRPLVKVLGLLMSNGSRLTGSSVTFLGLLGAVLSIAAWKFGWDRSVADEVVTTILALLVAVAIKLFISMVVLLLRAIVFAVGAGCNAVGLGKLLRLLPKSRLLRRWFGEIVSSLVLLGLLVKTNIPFGALIDTGAPLSLIILWLFLSCTVQMLSLLIGLGRSEGGNNQLADDLFFLHFFGLLCAAPSTFFAFNNLFNAKYAALFHSGLFDGFGSERINVVLAVTSIWLFGGYIQSFRSKLKIEPINGFQLVIEPEVPKQPVVCCHEDGGYKAIFEQVTNPAELHQVCPNVFDGPTYKVVKCFCPTNRSFKSAEEWCEWCRCAKCGYGKLIRPTWQDDEDKNKPRLHLDMAVILGLLLALLYVNYWGENKVYLLFYCIGGVFFMLWCRLFFKKSTIVLPDK